MGVAFSIGAITAAKLVTLFIFIAGSLLLVAHIFTFNDWADLEHGVKAPDPGVSSRRLLVFSSFLFVASLLVFALLDLRVVILGAIIGALGVFYSHPKLNGKGIPVASSSLHLAGGFVHFLLGYAVFTPIDPRGIFIALFFALTFTAGHLNHEVRHVDLDLQNNARTNAVAFGKRPVFFAGVIAFTLAYFCLFFLAWAGFMPRPLAFLAMLFYPLHLFCSLRALRHGLTVESLSRFQTQYRLLYAIIGISIPFFLFYR